jgi:hypothetical protein
MTLCRSLFARPEIVRGEQCAWAPLIQINQARNNRHIKSGRAAVVLRGLLVWL